VNVTDEMRRVGAMIGGEGNGGVIYPRVNFARDSLVGMALVLHLLAETGQTVSQILDSLPPFRMVKEKMPCPSHKIKDVMKMIRRDYAAYPLDTRDGVKVTVPGGWFLVRGSNTEPIVRVVAEAESEEKARGIVDAVFAQVQACVVS
jgi:phosphomannomutase